MKQRSVAYIQRNGDARTVVTGETGKVYFFYNYATSRELDVDNMSDSKQSTSFDTCRCNPTRLSTRFFSYTAYNNNNNTSICKAHIVSIRAEPEAPVIML